MPKGDSYSLVEIKGLKKYFPITGGLIFEKVLGWVKALDGIDLAIGRNEVIGLVGESGSGKSTLGKVLLRMLRPSEGEVLFEGKNIFNQGKNREKTIWPKIQAVFQDPFSSLSPRFRAGRIISEPLEIEGRLNKREIEDRMAKGLRMVGLDQAMANVFPHELSGGQRQRIAIARAISTEAKMIILDEPTSALDVSIRLQIVDLLMKLQKNLGLSYLLIGHDLAMVAYMSTYIAVMYLGKIIEFAETRELLQNTLHPYTRALISASLPDHPQDKTERVMLSGEIANPFEIPAGCRFHPRCPERKEKCSQIEPAFITVKENHRVACHF